MSNDCIGDDKALIIPGSKVVMSIFLTDQYGRPISLTPYTSGKLIFKNCKAIETEITLTVPGANPDKGELSVTISSAQSANADEKWVSADVELVDGASETTVVVLENKFEILPRVAP